MVKTDKRLYNKTAIRFPLYRKSQNPYNKDSHKVLIIKTALRSS